MSVRRMISLFVVLLCMCGVGAAQEAEPEPVIEGTASYRERIALPPEAAFEAMESAYSRASRGAGEPLFVTIAGRIVPRPDRDGEGTQMVVVADRFIGEWPGEICDPHRP